MANKELVYDITAALSEDIDWAEINDGNIPDFLPITGYDDTVTPFILYSFLPRMEDVERYYILNDSVRYYVYDNDVERMWEISRAIREYLNVGDGVEAIKTTMPDAQYRVLSSELVYGASFPALEREGFVNTVNEFKVKYVLL